MLSIPSPPCDSDTVISPRVVDKQRLSATGGRPGKRLSQPGGYLHAPKRWEQVRRLGRHPRLLWTDSNVKSVKAMSETHFLNSSFAVFSMRAASQRGCFSRTSRA